MRRTRKALKRLQNKSGVVLITVVILTFIMAILAVAMMSINVNQALLHQHQIERIKAEQFAEGAFWYNFANLSTSGVQAVPSSVTLDGKVYNVTMNSTAGNGPNNTNSYNVRVNY